jgi:iron complex outermembrane receptor protein
VFTAYDSNGDGTDDAFFGDFTNAGKATVQGIELELQWLATERQLSISGNLGLAGREVRRVRVAQTSTSPTRSTFTNAPEFSGALTRGLHLAGVRRRD